MHKKSKVSGGFDLSVFLFLDPIIVGKGYFYYSKSLASQGVEKSERSEDPPLSEQSNI